MRRAWSEPAFALVTSFSTNGRTAFALAMVVLMRPCSMRLTARFDRSASRWPCVRRSLTVFRWCRMCVFSLNDSAAQPLNGGGELGIGGIEIDETSFELH